MAANQQSTITTPTQIEFSFSPYMEKSAQLDGFFSESLIAQNRPSQPMLQNLLSPTSPNQALIRGSISNGDFDQAFADLIADTNPASFNQTLGDSSSALHQVFGQCEAPTKQAKLAPLVIPQPDQHLPIALPVKQNQEQEQGRQWHTVFVNPAFANMVEVSVSSKTRCEEPSAEVPDKLYSSLKYEIRHCATGIATTMVPFLLGRITVVDASDFSEILKDKKSVLKGTVEGSLVRPPVAQQECKLEGSLKCQFTDVSYHHKKKGFCFQISYFVPSDLEHPILIKRSASFMVFARKPNQNKKRKRTEPSETFEQFCSKLEDLVQASKKLKPVEKQNALELVSNKLLQLDPTFFIEQLKQQQQKN